MAWARREATTSQPMSSTSKGSPMQTSGHAPGHIRDQFSELIEDGAPYDPATVRALTGRLWNCTDILPAQLCTYLDLPTGSTYARASRRLRQD